MSKDNKKSIKKTIGPYTYQRNGKTVRVKKHRRTYHINDKMEAVEADLEQDLTNQEKQNRRYSKNKIKKLQYFHSIDCKDPERTLKYINSKKVNKRLSGLVDWHHWEEIEEEYDISPEDPNYEESLTFYHVKEFIDYTGIEGDKGVFLATNSCEEFDLFLEELEEVENEEGEPIGYNFWEDGELLFEWRYNEDGYLTEV